MTSMTSMTNTPDTIETVDAKLSALHEFRHKPEVRKKIDALLDTRIVLMREAELDVELAGLEGAV